jgi:hypothetical protein
MQTKVVPMNYQKYFWVSSIIWLFCVAPTWADTRFEIKGDTLVFNTEISSEDEGINYDDTDKFRDFLRLQKNIKRIQLTSGGGFSGAAYQILRIVEDHNLDTVASGECVSACSIIFLAGKNRTLELGSRLGFHGAYWAADSLKEHYDDQKEDYGWADEMAFSAWVYSESRRDVARMLKYLTSKNVTLDFIIKALSLDPDQYWYPSREELIKAKFITN